jgi:hypothetical protein
VGERSFLIDEEESIGKMSRDNCPSFEPLIEAIVDIALSNSPVSPDVMRVARLVG